MKRLVIAPLLVLALAACAGDPDGPGAQQPQQSQGGTPRPVTTTVLPTGTATAKSPTTVGTDLPDGRHYVHLKALDTKNRTVVVDVVQFLTGEAAQKAAQEDGEEPFEVYIRNQNKRLRTLSFTATVKVTVNTLAADETGSSSQDTQITLAKLQSYFAKGEAQKRIFYVTLKTGVVTAITEQFLS